MLCNKVNAIFLKLIQGKGYSVIQHSRSCLSALPTHDSKMDFTELLFRSTV